MVRDEIIESVDIFPTICKLAGVKMPDWVDGKDAEKLLKSDECIHEFAVTENPYTKTIHTKRFKLTQYLPEYEGKDFGELFDMEKDPFEMKNLYFEREYQDVVQKLRFQLYCWLVRTTRMKTVNPLLPIIEDGEYKCGISWDLADYKDSYDKDGKVGTKFFEELLKCNIKNYL